MCVGVGWRVWAWVGVVGWYETLRGAGLGSFTELRRMSQTA